MIAEHKKQGRGRARAKEITLREILFLRRSVRLVLVRHKCITEVNQKIRFVRRFVRQRARVHIEIAVRVEMRIGLNGERERCAGRAFRIKRFFRERGERAGIARAIKYLIEILGVRL